MADMAVVINADRNESIWLKEVCAGLEEEGVPFKVVQGGERSVSAMAGEAAAVSSLGVGIGISINNGALTMANLPEGFMLFETELHHEAQARALGKNAACVVKRKVMV